MAFSTRCLVASVTRGLSLITRDTVWWETPARVATSRIVGGRPEPDAIRTLTGSPKAAYVTSHTVDVTAHNMQKLEFDRGWRFQLGDIPGGIWQDDLDDAGWRSVDLPHDWSIELDRDPASPSGSDGGYFLTGVGWYQKRFAVPDEWRGKKLLVEFEGVYANAHVWLDEHFLGRHPYGYTTFHHDLTPYVEPGAEHTVRVLADNASQPNSRWYSGSGIYRHVWLWLGDPVHVGPWGVWVTTPRVSHDEAIVRVLTCVENELEEDREIVLRSRIDGGATAESRAAIPTRGRIEVSQELGVGSPELWSPETPRLYRLDTEVEVGGEVVDTVATTFGIRSLSFDAESGLQLNGDRIELRGGCVHHDHGPLGAASHDRAEERKVELLKASGFNAVRCAHNPPAPAFLDACDRLGLLVIDEAFDCWRNGKNLWDYHVSFDDWWRRDLDGMLLRDRNHPCVIIWSIGNEPVERGRPEGARIARMLADHVRSVDPTRPVTAGINAGHGDWPWQQLDDLFTALDVCGYNYRAADYRRDHERLPARVVYGSESVAREAHEHWRSVLECDHVIGDFVWTAIDYLGEAGIGRVHFEEEPAPLLAGYPWHISSCGDLDLCGFKRPQSFYRDVLWGRGEPLFIAVHPPGPEPTVTYWGWPDVRPSWSWPGHEDEPFRVDVYSACETVELFLNGESLGAKAPKRCIATFEAPYRPGILRAVGANPSAEVELRTAGEPARLRLAADRDGIHRGDLSFVTVEVVDADGLLQPNATHGISFIVDGPGTIAAVGSGDPAGTEPFRGVRRSAHRGRCLVVLRSRDEPGDIRLRADAQGLMSAVTSVRVA
jgi:beta-galactosidase